MSSMDGITQSVLSLLNEKVVDECVLEPYLEATAQWRVEHIFEIIGSGILAPSQAPPSLTHETSASGLNILHTDISTGSAHSPVAKKKKAPEVGLALIRLLTE